MSADVSGIPPGFHGITKGLRCAPACLGGRGLARGGHEIGKESRGGLSTLFSAASAMRKRTLAYSGADNFC